MTGISRGHHRTPFLSTFFYEAMKVFGVLFYEPKRGLAFYGEAWYSPANSKKGGVLDGRPSTGFSYRGRPVFQVRTYSLRKDVAGAQLKL